MTTGAEAIVAAVYGEEVIKNWDDLLVGLWEWREVAEGRLHPEDPEFVTIMAPTHKASRDAVLVLAVGDVQTPSDLVRGSSGVFDGKASLTRVTRLAMAVRGLAVRDLESGKAPGAAVFDLGALLEFLLAGDDKDAALEVVSDVCALAAALGYGPEDCPIAAMILMGVESGMSNPGTVNDLVEGE